MLRSFIGAGFGLASALAVSVTSAAQQLEIHYVNVGWGGSVLVRGPDGTTVLLEAGDTGKGSAQVVPYLQSIGIPPATGLDYTIVGHQHCDHVGGLDKVIQAGYDVHVENFYNGSSTTSTCVTQWNSSAGGTTAGAPVALPVGFVIQLGNGATMTCVARNGSILGGSSVAVSDENDRSLAVLVQYGGFDWIWASDLGGGQGDSACTGRTTSQTDVETKVLQAILPGGAAPLVSANGIDVLHVNHHGSESSTNTNWMNLSRPSVAVISTGAGQSATFQLPRIDVVEHVLLAQSTACVTAPAALVLQTEEGSPVGSLTSKAGFCVGDILITTNGVSTFTVSANGQVNQGPNEVALAGLPQTIPLDGGGAPPDTTPPAIPTGLVATGASARVNLTWNANGESDLAGYDLHRATVSGGPYTKLNANVLLTPSYSDTAVTVGTTYYYVVTAKDTAGNSSASSAQASAAPTAPTTLPWINEFHYDNNGTDTNEFVEIAGPAGTSLTGWKLIGYNGGDGAQYATVNLSGSITAQQNGFGTRSFSFAGLQNGSPDGIALVNASNVVVQFLGYEGSFTATNGPAVGLVATNLPVSETSTTPTGRSLRLTGSGCRYSDFAWQAPATSSAGSVNSGQTFLGTCP
ncbi:MAG: hypothetical protein IPJ77_15115 [Planctomycetes bacterium]|nr:hypothetical protein [Planctomycetota bacterium]